MRVPNCISSRSDCACRVHACTGIGARSGTSGENKGECIRSIRSCRHHALFPGMRKPTPARKPRRLGEDVFKPCCIRFQGLVASVYFRPGLSSWAGFVPKPRSGRSTFFWLEFYAVMDWAFRSLCGSKVEGLTRITVTEGHSQWFLLL